MNKVIKQAGLGLLLLSASISSTFAATQKIAYVATGDILAEMAKATGLNAKLQGQFKSRIDEVQRLEKALADDFAKVKRNVAVMSEKERSAAEAKLQKQDNELKEKVTTLRTEQAKMAGQEQNKLLDKLQNAVQKIAQQKGYTMVLDRNAVVFASAQDDLSQEVLKAVK
ncbi:MAG: OmpH family outer membrane protein [Vibrionaceae bacterium]